MSTLACLVLVAACQGAETADQALARIQRETEAAQPQITAQMARYVNAAASGNADSMLAVFAPDAVLMPPNRPASQGADAIRTLFAAVGPYQVTFRTIVLEVNGPIAIERGTWSAELSPPGSAFAVLRDGKFVTHWRRTGDAWLIAAQIWNDDYRPME